MGNENDGGHAVQITLTDSNKTIKGFVNFTGFRSGAFQEEEEVYDSKGAATFVIVVIMVYGLSIVLMIASVAKQKMKVRDADAEEKQIHRYLHQASDLREKGAKENYRQLKRNIINIVNMHGGKPLDLTHSKSSAFSSLIAIGSPAAAATATATSLHGRGDPEDRTETPKHGRLVSESDSLKPLLEEDEPPETPKLNNPLSERQYDKFLKPTDVYQQTRVPTSLSLQQDRSMPFNSDQSTAIPSRSHAKVTPSSSVSSQRSNLYDALTEPSTTPSPSSVPLITPSQNSDHVFVLHPRSQGVKTNAPKVPQSLPIPPSPRSHRVPVEAVSVADRDAPRWHGGISRGIPGLPDSIMSAHDLQTFMASGAEESVGWRGHVNDQVTPAMVDQANEQQGELLQITSV